MYRVLVTDDEPASLKHICNIIKEKCPDFVVTDTAGNGEAALEKINVQQPDIVFSDVMMPILNGIQLVTRVKEQYPDILSVIVSGYNDFEYVKGAIASGVCDYILKPVRPNDIVRLMDKLKDKLDILYYEKRKTYLKKILVRTDDTRELERLFPDQEYYAAIYRKNGLPSRFFHKFSPDMYSMPQEKIFIYGRDEQESLYICTANLLNGESFSQYFRKVYDRVVTDHAFYTAIVKEKGFSSRELPAVVRTLYRKLDECVIIGKNQIINLEERQEEKPEEFISFYALEYCVKQKDVREIQNQTASLFKKLEQREYPQIWLEEKIHYLLNRFVEHGYIERFSEFVLDDIFSEAVSMSDLEKNILALLCPQTDSGLPTDKREAEYWQIQSYINEHMEENLSAQIICRKFALSQTLLSKIFHKYGGASFSACLTNMRMEKAKTIMKETPGVLIKDVAQRTGYSDQFYFSRVFKSIVGSSPSEYIDKFTPKTGNDKR